MANTFDTLGSVIIYTHIQKQLDSYTVRYLYRLLDIQTDRERDRQIDRQPAT